MAELDMTLRVLKPGPMSLLQDLGRRGHAAKGLSAGGPMDEYAFAWANYLLKNPPNAAQLEISLGPCEFEAQCRIQFALTGADMNARINGEPIENWSTGQLESGDVLHLSLARAGLRAYLAVQGGFQAPNSLGSCSTVMREGLGGLHGNGTKLVAGDELVCSPSQQSSVRQTPWRYRRNLETPATIRFIAGGQFNLLKHSQQAQLLESLFTIQPDSDRMGYRLKGPRLVINHHKLSEGQCKGGIQLPPDGQPIILMADHQTIGGYPNLGCVIHSDISLLAQLRPGQTLNLEAISIGDALKKRQAFERFFQQA